MSSVLAPRPPMGWNSWDCFGSSVTEAEVIANAEFLAEHLLAHGWDTVVVDIQWYESLSESSDYPSVSTPLLDGWGRPQPVPERFPSAGDNGFTDLANRVHALGLKFGVHLMRGVPRLAAEQALPILGSDATCAQIADRDNLCPWNPDNDGVDMSVPGAQEYYDSVIAQLASWGVDFVKLDDVLYPPIQTEEIAAISRAIEASGREMLLSLSPGKQLSLENLEFLREHSQMWRISDDLWDDWGQLKEQFQRAARWAPHQRSGAWADADMLPLGRIGVRAHVGADRQSRFTFPEQQTMLTLWCLMRSPLMFGGHLPDTTPETLALITNDDVLAMLDSDGGREIVRDGDLVIWAAEGENASWRAVFWLGDDPASLRTHLADLGWEGTTAVRDLWTGESVPVSNASVGLEIQPHGVRLLRKNF